MSNTRVQIEVENWVCATVLPILYSVGFHKARLPLTSGGQFEFDAVSDDHRIAVVISTSERKTSGGKDGIGKQAKIFKDLYFLLLADVPLRIAAFTQPCMADFFIEQKRIGRVPANIEIVKVEVTGELSDRLHVSRQDASVEVRPTI